MIEKEQEIRSVVESMADGVVSVDHQGRIRAANPMVEALFGHRPQSLIGENLSVLIPGLGEKIVAGETFGRPSGGESGAAWTGLHRDGQPIARWGRDAAVAAALIREDRDRR